MGEGGLKVPAKTGPPGMNVLVGNGSTSIIEVEEPRVATIELRGNPITIIGRST